MKDLGKDLLTFMGVVSFFGSIAATARYINDLGRDNAPFNVKLWLSTVLVGVVVSIFAGFACQHLQVPDELSYVVIGVAAISAKELIEIAPRLAVRWLEKDRGT